jgi:hypothetical protein
MLNQLAILVSQVTSNASFIIFCQAVVVKADPTLKLVSDYKFSPIEGTIPTRN